MILIFSKDIDDFVNDVIDYLDEDFIRIGDFDNLIINSISTSINSTSFEIEYPYFSTINAEEIKSIWFNGGMVNTKNNEYENDCYKMLIETYLNYKDVKVAGRLKSNFELNKLDVILEAKKHGFKIPDTLITEKKNDLINFYQKYQQKNGIICKRITDRIYYKFDEYIHDFNLTFEVNQQLLNKIPSEFAISLFQERIKADFEIRVVYVLGTIYAMSIHSFEDETDYRVNMFSNKIRTIPFQFPEEIEKNIKKVFEKLNLNYGSADLMYKNNDYYFLEINPTGQVGFVNSICNYSIEKQLSNYLQNEKPAC